MKRNIFVVSLLTVVLVFFACGKEEPVAPELTQSEEGVTLAKQQGTGDPAVLAKMQEINEQLAAQGLNIMVVAIDFFTIGGGRSDDPDLPQGARILQQPFRWVPNDPNRLADGDNITYIVDQSMGATASGLSNAQTEAAIDRALTTWNDDQALQKVDLVKRSDPGGDLTIYDWFYDFGGFGNYLASDIVNAGWWPREFFEAVGGPAGGRGILAFSVTFIWTSGGVPTDINGDNYLDTALNEVYYNDTFGDPGDDRAGNPWGIDEPQPGIDVETVALHENGHSLGIGHFGPPPDAVLNPVYAGIRQSLFPTDQAAMNAVWSSWPNP